MKFRVVLFAAIFCAFPTFAQMVEVEDEKAPATGKERASEYFQSRKTEKVAAATNSGSAPRFLMIHAGTFFSDQGFKWGRGDQNNIGRLNAGVTYRMGEWVNSMDWALRMDYSSYDLPDGDARKISIGAILTFPDSNSRFPLYFGGGLGTGFFIKQLDDESPMTLDYSLLLGARFFDVIESTGFMIETGLKNHLHLFSDGQFNGVYVNVGCVFAF